MNKENVKFMLFGVLGITLIIGIKLGATYNSTASAWVF